jgi:rod shape-determining protein MreD
MSSFLAAVGATVAALLETTVGPHVGLAGAAPHPVLVLGVVWTVAAGVESGLVWAFVGGLALDVLAGRPLGSSPFALLFSLGAASILARPLSRIRPVSPVPLVFTLSFLNSLLLLAAYGALRAPVPDPEPLRTLLPGVLYDTALAALIGPIVMSLRDRHVDRERADW